MNGLEYTDLVNEIAENADSFEKVVVGEPLLTSDDDFKAVIQAITDATKEYDDGETAICFMGHGTEADSNQVYAKMQDMLTEEGFEHYYVGTVEATPSLEDVVAKVKEGSYKKVVLEPLMIVAGDHANNDMAGDDEDSWKSQFTASGYFDSVDTQISGLGRIEAIQQIYIDHTKDAIDSLGDLESTSTTESTVGTLEAGVYTAKFDTDSSMFHVNEADEGRGILTVENGKMTIHISLVSKKIVNLFVGTADDAKKDGADILEPTTDTVKYSDGTTDEVYGFDVPVEALDEEFDLAILGTKGEWYDHKVSVSDPQETDN